MNWYLMALKKYAVFSGRSQRMEYWMFVLFNFLIAVVLGVLDQALGFASEEGGGVLSGIYALAVLIPGIAVAVRRMHDIGKSGWWVLIVLIPVIGVIVLLVLAAMDSQPGENEYGPNPKGVAA